MSEYITLAFKSQKEEQKPYYFMKKCRHWNTDGWTFIFKGYSKRLWLLMEFLNCCLIGHLATRDFSHPIPLRYCPFLGRYSPILLRSALEERADPSGRRTHIFIPGNRATDLQSALHRGSTLWSSHYRESYSAFGGMGAQRSILEASAPLAEDFGGKEDVYRIWEHQSCKGYSPEQCLLRGHCK